MGNFFAMMAASAQKNIKPMSPLEQAKLDFDKAKLNLQNAPGEVDKTEEKYIVLDKGQAKYDILIKDRVVQKSLNLAATMSEEHKSDMHEIKPFIAQYETDKMYDKQRAALFNMRTAEIAKLEASLDKNVLASHTNSRRVIYEDADMESLERFRTASLVLYYALLIVFVLFGPIKEFYALKYFWLVVVVYLILPWGINMFVRGLFWLKFVLLRLFSALPYKSTYEFA